MGLTHRYKWVGGNVLYFYFLGYPFVCGRGALVDGSDEINYALVWFAADLGLILLVGLIVHRILSFAISGRIVSLCKSARRGRW